MYLSTEEYPSAVRLSRHLPFHRLSESLAGVFLSTMAPLTRWNSTSEFGWIPNRSRISFGMVTCPRSPTFIFSSMNQNTYLRKQQEGIHRGDAETQRRREKNENLDECSTAKNLEKRTDSSVFSAPPLSAVKKGLRGKAGTATNSKGGNW